MFLTFAISSLYDQVVVASFAVCPISLLSDRRLGRSLTSRSFSLLIPFQGSIEGLAIAKCLAQFSFSVWNTVLREEKGSGEWDRFWEVGKCWRGEGSGQFKGHVLSHQASCCGLSIFLLNSWVWSWRCLKWCFVWTEAGLTGFMSFRVSYIYISRMMDWLKRRYRSRCSLHISPSQSVNTDYCWTSLLCIFPIQNSFALSRLVSWWVD